MTPSTDITQELLNLERKFWQSIQDKDFETAVGLTDFPCIVAGAQGVMSVDRKTFLEMMKAENSKLDRFELRDGAQTRILSDNVAVIAYDVHEELTVDGKPVSMDASETSVWTRRNGRWVCSMHSESFRGDPYGRDRALRSA
jgi:hypothetical protein